VFSKVFNLISAGDGTAGDCNKSGNAIVDHFNQDTSKILGKFLE